MSISEVLDYEGRLSTSVLPNLRALGFTNEIMGGETPHVLNTRGRLVLLEGKTALLDLATANLQNKTNLLEANLSALDDKVNNLPGGGVSQADFLNLVQLVNSQSLLIDQLNARLNYADAYLKMIDEAIHIEGFPGWNPPDFS